MIRSAVITNFEELKFGAEGEPFEARKGEVGNGLGKNIRRVFHEVRRKPVARLDCIYD